MRCHQLQDGQDDGFEDDTLTPAQNDRYMRNLKDIIFSLNFLYIVLIAAEIAAIIFLCVLVPAALPLAAAASGAWFLSLVTAAVIVVRGGAEESQGALFLVCALPVLGAAIYLILSSGKKRRGILKVEGEADSPLSRLAKETCGTVQCGYDGAKYFKSGAECFDSMFLDIAQARESVYAEFFIAAGGKVFDTFLKAAESAIEKGAKVKVLLDGVGCAFKLKRRDIKRLKATGAEVKIFGKITPLPRARLNLRDHRKIVAIDGKIAYIGGINLADEYAGLYTPYGYWKDNAVKIWGGAAKIFEGMFLSMWEGKYETDAPEGGKYECLPFGDGGKKARFAESAFLHAIYSAKERVHILTPYFCAGGDLNGALKCAALRGVDVKIILPHIPDKKYAFELSKATAEELAPFGVQFFEFSPGFMHAKAVICDDLVFLGSYNFDFRSTRTNFECGAAFAGEICEQVERDFCGCLALSQKMNEGKLSPAKRFSRLIIKLIAPLI